MKTVKMVLVLLCVFVSLAQAQVDPRPDVLGVYFDQGGTSIHTHWPPYQVIYMYVVLTRPTVSAITGWEGGVDISGPAYVLPAVLPNGGSNSLAAPMYRVNYTSPLACSMATVVMTLPVILLNPYRQCIGLFAVDNPVVPGTMPVLYLEGGGYLQAEVNLMGDVGNTVAQLNGEEEPVIGGNWWCADAIRNETSSWGSLKSLYR